MQFRILGCSGGIGDSCRTTCLLADTDIWPDFTVLPNRASPAMRFAHLAPLETVTLGDREIQVIPVNHILPGVGYRVTSAGSGGCAFSGDTGTNDAFWDALNGYAQLYEAAIIDRSVQSTLCTPACTLVLAGDDFTS